MRLDSDSVNGVADLAFRDPGELADGLNLTARRETLPKVDLGIGDELGISLLNRDGDFTEIRYRDGRRDRQKTTFSYRYPRAGTFTVTGIAIDNTTVKRFRLPVEVDRRGHGDKVRVVLPDDDRLPDALPPLERAVPPLPA